jgi:hypothetical protein
MVSAKRLDACRFAVTTYQGFTKTRPSGELSDLAWDELVEVVSPKNGPLVVADKRDATYYTPGLLKDAPLVGETLAAAKRIGAPLVGKQRSGTHVTDGAYLSNDFDGITTQVMDEVFTNFKTSGMTFVAFTSHSFGREDKPGLRFRIVSPLDREATPAEYKAVQAVFDARFCESAGDRTAGNLYQQQGVWATAQEREHMAKRWSQIGRVLSVDAMLKAAQLNYSTAQPHKTEPANSLTIGPPPSITQIKAALGVLDPNDYGTWNAALSYCTAIANGKGVDPDAVKSAFLDYSTRADQASQRGNDLQQYDPANRFDSWVPSISPEIGAAALFSAARNAGERIYREAAARRNFKGAKPAWSYLAAYHPKTWSAIRAETERDQ